MFEHSGLLTDLYELTMAAGYLQARATFELFVRHLPPHRNYLVAAGLEQALDFLENVHFSAEEIDYLRQHPVFRNIRGEFFEYLAKFRFTGDVWAMPEGSLVFPGEPMLRVVAPIIEGQIMETYFLSTLSYQTMIASKAARVVTAAKGRQVVEFGARRAHGSQQYGMETYGTQAHSWVMAHEDETEAFSQFLDAFPEHAVLLLDTYDVHTAVKRIIAMNRKPAGVRLDSGDLAKDSQWVRRELNRAGWKHVKIFASGDLDETRIAALIAKHAAIDAFGVGTALATPGDAPHLNLIYKLVEVERGGKVREAAKLSAAKVTYPGRKQVFRYSAPSGEYRHDRIALQGEPADGGEPMLVEVMRGGRRVAPAQPVADLRARCVAGLARLPKTYRQINRTAVYPVRYTKRLEALLEKLRRRIRRSALK